MSGRHAATEAPVDHNESARKLAESVSSTLTEEQRVRAGVAARMVGEGLLGVCNGDADVASKIAMAFAKLISMLGKSPIEDAGMTIDQTVVAYSLASGSLAGVYTLAAPPESNAKMQEYLTEMGIDPADLEGHQTALATSGPNDSGDATSVKYL